MVVEHKVVKKNVERVSRARVGLVIIEYIVVWFQTAAHGLSSRLRDPTVVGTCWGGPASTWRLWPSHNVWGVVKQH